MLANRETGLANSTNLEVICEKPAELEPFECNFKQLSRIDLSVRKDDYELS